MTHSQSEPTTDPVFAGAPKLDLQVTTSRVTQAYESAALDVQGMLGTEISLGDPDRAIIEPWAAAVDGHILDVGAGTGRWTRHLARLGHAVEGVEPAKRLITLARVRHPSVVFHHGSIEDFAHSQTRWGGILAWYSLIHLSPEELPHALAILRTLLTEGGSLLMSFFSGPQREAFDHPIATAYRWPMTELVHILTQNGFEVVTQHSNPQSAHAYVSARVKAH